MFSVCACCFCNFISVAGVAASLDLESEPDSRALLKVDFPDRGTAGGGINGSDRGSGETESCTEFSLLL